MSTHVAMAFLFGAILGSVVVFLAAIRGYWKARPDFNPCYSCGDTAKAVYRADCGDRKVTRYACSDHAPLAATAVGDWILDHARCDS